MSELEPSCSMIPPFTASERDAAIAACERQVNELAEINKELLEALKACMPFIDDADDVNQLFPESSCSTACRNAVKLAKDAIAKAKS